ncbi:MORC family CW-type zinc finger protein 3-like isoform X1 [Leucoraja erinacea]|uniref:MORC family CW-type zinc finger protein 3-like isoform X1 n=1 Tax=Leucoraja erinaceus TaxID=7782 RepID=UPI002455FFEA|nr:MORC family CW-type zinc finger protein 3-like isoform X1 [Leucoraja erinacea]
MLAPKEVELLKQQSQALVNPKQECCIEKEEDKQAQQLEDMSRQLDTCKSERDQLKDKVDQLQKENDAFQLHCANLSNEVECLKQEVTEARPSKSSANTGVLGPGKIFRDVHAQEFEALDLFNHRPLDISGLVGPPLKVYNQSICFADIEGLVIVQAP